MNCEVLASVDIGPFRVADAAAADVVSDIVRLGGDRPDRAKLVYALHVGGLNHRDDRQFVAAMRAADLVYADGGSIVWLGKRAGATRIERAPTTDIGWDILRVMKERNGARPRVALLGGERGLAERASRVLEDARVADVVDVEHGYHSDWSVPLERVREAKPNITIVGLGAPFEMVWAHRMRQQLPAGIVLTCGGWFGHLVGDERRAPRILRKPGLEWIARVAQQPGRLGPRYLQGMASTLAMAGAVRPARIH